MLEYCSTVLYPWQKYLVYKIEQVQRDVYNDYNYTSNVSKMLKDLTWHTRTNTRTKMKH